MSEIKAIETRYKGYRFRSRLEARWAVFFDALGVKWEYEKEGYELPSGNYLPDFFLPEDSTYVEIKPPAVDPPGEWVYVAGKCYSGWREDFSLRGNWHAGPSIDRTHSPGLHGDTGNNSTGVGVLNDCLEGIKKCDTLFAWIDSTDAYATLAEIGFARGLGKDLYVGIDRGLHADLSKTATPFYQSGDDYGGQEIEDGHGSYLVRHDLWFIETMAEPFFGWFGSAQEAYDFWFEQLCEEEKKCADLSTRSGVKGVRIVRGDPVECKEHTEFRLGHVHGRKVFTSNYFRSIGRDYGKERTAREFEAATLFGRQARFEYGETPRF